MKKTNLCPRVVNRAKRWSSETRNIY